MTTPCPSERALRTWQTACHAALKRLIKRLLGPKPVYTGLVGIEALVRDWTFHPSRGDWLSRIEGWRRRGNHVPAPAHRTLISAGPRARWMVYFIYAPDGRLSPAHRFTLARLRADDAGLMVVFAAPDARMIPAELAEQVDALYWKDLPGFDFSAYAVALDALAALSPGADVFVMNDSVYGPFCPVDAVWADMKWDFTGFTASSNIRNHIQSYAFLLHDWTPAKRAALNGVMRPGRAYDGYRDVVFCQEAMLATVAARSMSVGALWYGRPQQVSDATIQAGLPLMAAGFPFLKRSLFTKYPQMVDQAAALATLAAAGHPPHNDKTNT